MAMAEGLEGNRGAGVSHGEKLNSHLTMFNGLDRRRVRGVPEWDEFPSSLRGAEGDAAIQGGWIASLRSQ
jgi:hypothetical protein